MPQSCGLLNFSIQFNHSSFEFKRQALDKESMEKQMERQQHESHVFCSTYLFVACLMSNYALLQILNDTLSRIKVRNFILMFLVHGNISGMHCSYHNYTSSFSME